MKSQIQQKKSQIKQNKIIEPTENTLDINEILFTDGKKT